MPKNGKSAIFVLGTLLAAVIAAMVTTLRENAANAVPVLVETTLVAAAMVLVAGWTAYRLWRLEQARQRALNNVLLRAPNPRPWRWMSRRQWTILTLGLAVIATFTSAVAGVHVMDVRAAPVSATPTAHPSDNTPPTVAPSPTDVAQSSPEPGVDPTTTEDPPTDSPAPPTIAYLDSIGTVNASYHHSGPVYFSGHEYPRSVTLVCQSYTDYFIWSVAGYNTFTATLGVDDNTSSALGGIAELIFYDQDGRQLANAVDVSLAHTKKVTVSLAGVVQLKITCAGRDAKTHGGRDFYAALGDAVITQ